MKRFELTVAITSLGVLAIACLLYFWGYVDWAILPLWDEASHSIKGARFTRQLAEFRIIEFLDYFYNRNGLWPPLLGLFQIPVFGVLGYEFEAARMLTRAFWVFGVVVMFVLAYRLGNRRLVFFPFIVTVLFMLNPYMQAFANLSYTELPGAVLMSVVVLLYTSALVSGSHRMRVVAYFASFLFFLYKYNYAALVVVPMIISELQTAWSQIHWRRIAAMVVSRVDVKRWFFWVIIGYLNFLVFIHLSGGIVWQVNDDVTIFIQKISGNPVYFLVLLIAIYLYSYKRTEINYIYRNEFNKDFRAWLYWAALPVCLWLINPMNFRGFMGHSVNHATLDTSFWHQLGFYPIAFVTEYFSSPWLGLSLVIGCVISSFLWRQLSREARFIGLVVLCGLVILTMHQHKGARHLAPLTPMILLWASVWIMAVETRLRKLLWGRWLGCGAMVAIASATLAFSWHKAEKVEQMQAQYSYSDHSDQLDPALDCLCELGKKQSGVYIMGIWNRMSMALVNQYCWSRFAPYPLDHSMQSLNARRIFYGSANWQRLKERFDISKLVLVHYDGKFADDFDVETEEIRQYYSNVRESNLFSFVEEKQCGGYYRFEFLRVIAPLSE